MYMCKWDDYNRQLTEKTRLLESVESLTNSKTPPQGQELKKMKLTQKCTKQWRPEMTHHCNCKKLGNNDRCKQSHRTRPPPPPEAMPLLHILRRSTNKDQRTPIFEYSNSCPILYKCHRSHVFSQLPPLTSHLPPLTSHLSSLNSHLSPPQLEAQQRWHQRSTQTRPPHLHRCWLPSSPQTFYWTHRAAMTQKSGRT